jgi:hypothetical protein
MNNVHAERKAASLCSSPNSQHCSQFSKQKGTQILSDRTKVKKKVFKDPSKPEICSPLPSSILAVLSTAIPRNPRRWITPLMRCSAAQTCVHGVSFFHLAMTFLAGYPFWDMVTQSLRAWDVRGPIPGQRMAACQESLPSITLVEILFLRALFDNDNRPESLKTALISSRCKTAAPP